jgi:uncharacterized membrane protein
MALDTYVILANEYDREADALADYEAVRELYLHLRLIETFDAAVITRGPDGKVAIVKRTEEPARHGGARGLLIGLAVGAAVALFPAISLGVGAGMLAGGTLGAGLGAVAGHVVGGMKRSDLKELGEVLDLGNSGLLVIAATDLEGKINTAITKAEKRATARLQADLDALKSELGSAARSAGQGR